MLFEYIWLYLKPFYPKLMKKKFTLIIVLFFFLRLSVFAINADTVKLLATPSHADSSALTVPLNYATFSVKLTAAPIRQYSVKLSAQINNSGSIKLPVFIVAADSTNIAANTDQTDNNLRRLTSMMQLDSLRATLVEAQNQRDSVTLQIKRNVEANIARLLKVSDPDSLRMELKRPLSDTVKGVLYTHLAGYYLHYDTIANKKKQLAYQNEALTYTLLAIQQYAAYDDSTALRLSFDNLAKVYYSQKKFTQAKWFILQSNTLSRAKADTSNIISSLLTLSTIKSDIKDYNLALRDLNEALQLSINIHSPKTESQVLKNYALLYHRLKDFPKEAMVLKKRDSLEDKMRKTEEAQLAAQNVLQKKKLDSLQNKKKVYSSNIRKLYKNNSSRKIASL
jgi:tetratricopeptide (TPR) repeat protein